MTASGASLRTLSSPSLPLVALTASAVDGRDAEARADQIESWTEAATESLLAETDTSLLSRYLEEMAWIRWQSDAELGARALLAVSDAVSRDESAVKQITRARVEGIFAPLLAELRVVEEFPLDATDAR